MYSYRVVGIYISGTINSLVLLDCLECYGRLQFVHGSLFEGVRGYKLYRLEGNKMLYCLVDLFMYMIYIPHKHVYHYALLFSRSIYVYDLYTA